MQPKSDNTKPHFTWPTPNSPETDDVIGRLLEDTSIFFEQPTSSPNQANLWPSPGFILPPPPYQPKPNQVSSPSLDDLLEFNSRWLDQTASSWLSRNPESESRPPMEMETTPPRWEGSVVPTLERSGRKHFRYTDSTGETQLLAQASFWDRLGGAVIDAMLAGVIVLIFSWILVIISLSTVGFGGCYDCSIKYRNQREEEAINFTLVLVKVKIVSSFLYYLLMVGLTGKTLGHRIVGIKVVGANGQAPGFISAFVRAFYGSIPGIVNVILLTNILHRQLSLSAIHHYSYSISDVFFTENVVTILSYLLISVSFIWILLDKAGQGLHDKLAHTYVVKSQPVYQLNQAYPFYPGSNALTPPPYQPEQTTLNKLIKRYVVFLGSIIGSIIVSMVGVIILGFTIFPNILTDGYISIQLPFWVNPLLMMVIAYFTSRGLIRKWSLTRREWNKLVGRTTAATWIFAILPNFVSLKLSSYGGNHYLGSFLTTESLTIILSVFLGLYSAVCYFTGKTIPVQKRYPINNLG